MKPLLILFHLACGADAASSHLALHQHPGVVREQVLPTQNPWVIDGVVAGEAAVTTAGALWLRRHDHPKWAKGIVWLAVGVRAVAVAQNIRTLRRLR